MGDVGPSQAVIDAANAGDFDVPNEGAGMNTGFDPSAGVVGGPEAQPSVSLDALGDQPSLEELSAAMGIDPAALGPGGGAVEGGPESSPQDIIGSQVAGEEAGAEEVAGFDPSAAVPGGSPGEETAAFLSDFNQGMTAQSPEQGLVAKIDALQNQAAQLQAQAAGGGHPDWGMSGSAIPMGAELAAMNINAAGGWNGGKGWNKHKGNPNDPEAYTPYELGNPVMEDMDIRTTDHMRQDRSAPSATGYQGEELALATATGLGPQGPVISNVTAEQAALTASGGLTRGSDIRRQEELGITPSGGQGWVDPDALPDTGFITDVSMAPQTQAQKELSELISLEEDQSTTLAPKYSGETVDYQTHAQMYPDHQMKAAMAGVASIISMFDGTHAAWIESINKDMKDRNIELTHEINGVRTGKHSSADWKEYNDLFTVGEDGVPRDSNGVAMKGTEKQAQAGVGSVLQGLWGGALSGVQNLFKPKTSSGVVEEPLLETGATTFGEVYDRAEPVRSEGGEGRGDHPIDIMRSIYPWAASLPNDVLFNAARYPDYLRLLIEAAASKKELPLTVPDWILEGGENPNTSTTNGDETTANWIADHAAMQVQKPPAGWGSAPWLT